MGTSAKLSLTLILSLAAHTVYGQVWNPLGLWKNSKKADEALKALKAPQAALFANASATNNVKLETAEQNSARAKENLLSIDSFYQRAERGGGDKFFLREVVPTLANVINRKDNVKRDLLQKYSVLYSNEQLIKEALEEHKRFVSLVGYDEWFKKQNAEQLTVSMEGKDTVVDPRLYFLAEQMYGKMNDLRTTLPEEEKTAIVQYAEAKDQEMSLLLDHMLRENGEKIKDPAARRRIQSSLDSYHYRHNGNADRRALQLDLEALPSAKPEN